LERAVPQLPELRVATFSWDVGFLRWRDAVRKGSWWRVGGVLFPLVYCPRRLVILPGVIVLHIWLRSQHASFTLDSLLLSPSSSSPSPPLPRLLSNSAPLLFL
jgi:hypothetical protein